MHYIDITVRNKIAVNPSKAVYVCGNSDFIVRFDFDAEWDGFEAKTARFDIGNGAYKDVVFTGNECSIPVISNIYKMWVGVYAGNLSTTTAAYVPCKKSILCTGGSPAAPDDDTYHQIMAMLKLGGGAQGDWMQNIPSAADYILNRTHYETPDYDFPAGTTYPTPKVEAKLYRTADGTENGYSLHKISDVAPTLAELKIGGCSFTLANAVEFDDGYTLSSANGDYRYLRVAVCLEAGCVVTGGGIIPGVLWTEEVTATLPEPGLYLMGKAGTEESTVAIRWSGYVAKTLDEKFLPDTLNKNVNGNVIIPAKATLTIDANAKISDPGGKLGGMIRITPESMEGTDISTGFTCVMNKAKTEVVTAIENGQQVVAIMPSVVQEGLLWVIPLMGLSTDGEPTFMSNTPYGWFGLTYTGENTALYQMLTV